MSDTKKGRNPVQFDDAKIYSVLLSVKNGSPEISAYYLKRKFSEELGFITIGLEKAIEGRGRRRKVYSLTSDGAAFITNYQQSSGSKD